MLNAAAELIAKSGVDGMTMSAVGAAAGSAPGSLYQFFPSREALIEALAKREAAAVEACVEASLSTWRATGEQTSEGLIDALLPPLLEAYRESPAWGELLHALARRGAPGDLEQALDARIQVMLADALSRLAPQASPAQSMLAAALMLNFGHAGVLSASRDLGEIMLAEVRRALVAYLTAWTSAYA